MVFGELHALIKYNANLLGHWNTLITICDKSESKAVHTSGCLYRKCLTENPQRNKREICSFITRAV